MKFFSLLFFAIICYTNSNAQVLLKNNAVGQFFYYEVGECVTIIDSTCFYGETGGEGDCETFMLNTACEGLDNVEVINLIMHNELNVDLSPLSYFRNAWALGIEFQDDIDLPYLPNLTNLFLACSSSYSSASVSGISQYSKLKNVTMGNMSVDFSKLSDSVKEIGLMDNCQLVNSQPVQLPPSLEKLHIDAFLDDENGGIIDGLNFAPDSDSKLNGLYIGLWSSIKSITGLPASLKELEWDGYFEQLPDLPNGLQRLVVSYSDLTSIKNLPDSLQHLDCYNNKKLQHIGRLPENLSYLNVLNTQVSCLPNETNFIKATEELPLCKYISGKVYYDANKNGVIDTEDVPSAQAVIELSNGILTAIDEQGAYSIMLPQNKPFQITLHSNHPHAIVNSPSGYSIDTTDTGVESRDFLVQLGESDDLQITAHSLVARPGMRTSVTPVIENFSFSNIENATVKLLKPEAWTLEDVEPSGYTISSDTIIWNSILLNMQSSRTIKATFTLPATATILGDEFSYELWVNTPEISEYDYNNNYYKLTDVVRGSYDPNDKLVSAETLFDTYNSQKELQYTIRFQNTGTDTAFKVVVIDTIQGNLNPQSIRFICSSHPCKYSLTENGIATFRFDNILLPDSNVDEQGSHGFIRIGIRPLDGLRVGDKIQNKAAIYFDFNEPVITEYATTAIVIPTIIKTGEIEVLKVYPNPAKSSFIVQTSEKENALLRIVDLNGKEVHHQRISGNQTNINTEKLSSGLYLINIISENRTTVGKVMILK